MLDNHHKSQYRLVPASVKKFYAGKYGNNCPSAYYVPVENIYRFFCAHQHEDVEILTVTKGELLLDINGKSFTVKEKQTAIINPFFIHNGFCRADTYTEYYCMMIDTRSFSPTFKSSLFSNIGFLLNRQGCINDIITDSFLQSAVISLYDNKKINEEQYYIKTLNIIYYIFENHFTLQKETRLNVNLDFILKITIYLENNYAKDISTNTACDELGYSINHFCRLFKVNFSNTFSNYLCEFRINKAAMLFRDIHMPVNQMAAKTGFKDYCYFSRSFKKYIGVSPAIYFKKRNPSKVQSNKNDALASLPH